MVDRRDFLKIASSASVFGLMGSPGEASPAAVPTLFKNTEEIEAESSESAAVVVFKNRIYLFFSTSSDLPLIYCVFDRYGNYEGWAVVPNAKISGKPAVAVYNGVLYLVYHGYNHSGWLYYNTFDGNNWSGNKKMPCGVSYSPALAVFRGKLYCAHQGYGGDGWIWLTSFDGTSWASDRNLHFGITESPALAVFGGFLYCAHQGSRYSRGGWLWVSRSRDGDSWDSDTVTEAGMHGGPTLFVFQNKLFCCRRGWGSDATLWQICFDGRNWSNETKLPIRSDSDPYVTEISGTLIYITREGGKILAIGYSYQTITSDIYILDVWGEGRIVESSITTGFQDALNLNKYTQTISNGAYRSCEIPNLCPVGDYDDPIFPIKDGVVENITVMGAPITVGTAREMLRVIKKSGSIYLYNPPPTAEHNFESLAFAAGFNYIPGPVDLPFNEPSIHPIFHYRR